MTTAEMIVLCEQAASDQFRAVAVRLRELEAALRAHAIVNETGNKRGKLCVVCARRWPKKGSENHAPGCLAALRQSGSDHDG